MAVEDIQDDLAEVHGELSELQSLEQKIVAVKTEVWTALLTTGLGEEEIGIEPSTPIRDVFLNNDMSNSTYCLLNYNGPSRYRRGLRPEFNPLVEGIKWPPYFRALPDGLKYFEGVHPNSTFEDLFNFDKNDLTRMLESQNWPKNKIEVFLADIKLIAEIIGYKKSLPSNVTIADNTPSDIEF